ncbi:hypothetical protein NPIL_697701 [Nephila pilipes]|uniref:Uncharacterized protein n=1 Tax=Nephila pilipes TaxID=299642 RepID=A0A8X6MLK8_NEPPI|nr:hypothetical protein NPIL_697701 [Nephila pilipes]
MVVYFFKFKLLTLPLDTGILWSSAPRMKRNSSFNTIEVNMQAAMMIGYDTTLDDSDVAGLKTDAIKTATCHGAMHRRGAMHPRGAIKFSIARSIAHE